MTLTKGRINRTGTITFGDASLNIIEEPGRLKIQKQTEWDHTFKKQVFTRIIQTLNRIGWTCVIPEEYITTYSVSFARNYRQCNKGNLKAELELSGRCIHLKMFQNVNAPNRPDHDGQFEWNKELIMPYPLKLEMERTRRRIAAYLSNVFTGYKLQKSDPHMGFNGVTALEWIQHDTRKCWHYNKDIDRRSGEDLGHNNQSADKAIIKHGQKVWTTDHKGRIRFGTSYYNINNMWWVVTGKYERLNKANFEIFVNQPKDLRTKLNHKQKKQRLQELLKKSIEAMNFEKAAILRDILYPDHPSSKSC